MIRKRKRKRIEKDGEGKLMIVVGVLVSRRSMSPAVVDRNRVQV
jgi:hypothetical protein